jgi:hypothetical protein
VEDDEGMPKPGNPQSYRCRHCGQTRRIRRGTFFCPGCDHIDPDAPLPPLRGGGAPFRNPQDPN